MPAPRVFRIVSAVGLTAGLYGLVGCRSAVSTHVAPAPGGVGWETRKLRGVPVKVTLPTHLEITVIEQQFYDPAGKVLLSGTDGVSVLKGRRVEVAVRERDQIFTVDAVRPAAGKLTYTAEFENQYFKSFNTKVEDQTIQDITKVIGNLAPTIEKARAGAAKSLAVAGGAANVKPIESVVASQIFDLRDPGLESRVQQFLQTYVNGCADCPVPPVVVTAAPVVLEAPAVPAVPPPQARFAPAAPFTQAQAGK